MGESKPNVESRFRYDSLKKSEVFFWLGFWTLYIKFFVQSISIFNADELILRFLLLFGSLFLIIRFLCLLSSRSIGFFATVGILLGLLSYAMSGETILFTTILIVVSAYSISVQTILREWTRVTGCILAIMTIAYVVSRALGITVGNVFVNIGGSSEIRNALFFVHPNYCAVVFFAWAIALSCRKDLHAGIKITALILSGIAIRYIAGSRTSAVCLLLFCLLCLLLRWWQSHYMRGFYRFCSISLIVLPLLLALLTFWIASFWFTGPSFSQSISNFLTGRPALWWAQWNFVGLTVFGQHAFTGVISIRGTMHDIHTVDGMYASFLFNIGLSGFIWLILSIFRTIKSRKRDDIDFIYISALLSIFILGFTEWHSANVIVCIPLILLSTSAQPLKNLSYGARRQKKNRLERVEIK